MIAAIILIVVFILFNLLLWCQWDSVKTAIAVIDAAADFVVATKRLAIITVVYTLVGVLFLILYFFGLMSIISLNEIRTVPNINGVYEK